MNTVVETRQGKVRGSVSDGVITFKGIPYAAPPFGANRFRAPQPVEPWRGVRDALAFGPNAPQVPYPPPLDVLIPDYDVQGEDCLILNIWAPALGSAGCPVMVWVEQGSLVPHPRPALVTTVSVGRGCCGGESARRVPVNRSQAMTACPIRCVGTTQRTRSQSMRHPRPCGRGSCR